MRAATYDYGVNGEYAETVATLGDGRKMLVNTQYATVCSLGRHADSCSQVTKIGGRCDCGKLDGVNIDALIADARVNGKFGKRLVAKSVCTTCINVAADTCKNAPCSRCGTWCCGDCGAAR